MAVDVDAVEQDDAAEREDGEAAVSVERAADVSFTRRCATQGVAEPVGEGRQVVEADDVGPLGA